jgi:hypothetical protein
VLDHRPFDAFQLRRAHVDLAPLKAKAFAHQSAEVRLVEEAGGRRRSIEGRAVQSREAPV